MRTARITKIDVTAARQLSGVVATYTGHDLIDVVSPYVGVLTHLQGLRSAPQMPLSVDTARWVGEPLVMVLAESRAVAEDACELVDVEFEILDAACDAEKAPVGGEPCYSSGVQE